MCRRPIHRPEGLIAVVDRLARILPVTTKIHAFGVKGDALAYLKPYENCIASIDSQAFGISARQETLRRGVPKTNALVADHMEHWYRRQSARLLKPARHVQPEAAEITSQLDAVTANRWDRAIHLAREQIRDLIESGDLAHDEITSAWIEEWAAGIYHQRHAARCFARFRGA